MKTVCLIICLLPTLILSETFRQHYRQNGDRARALNFIDQPVQDADTINMILRGDIAREYQQYQKQQNWPHQQSKSSEQNEMNLQQTRRINKQQTDSAEQLTRQIKNNQVKPWALANRQNQKQYSSENQQPNLQRLYSEQQQLKKQWRVYNQQQQQDSSSSQHNSASQEQSTSHQQKSQEQSSSQDNSNESNKRQDVSIQQDSSSGQQDSFWGQQKSSRKLINNKNKQGSSSQEDSLSQQQTSSEQQDSQQVITENKNQSKENKNQSNDKSDSSSQQQDSTEQQKVESPRKLNLKSKKRSTTPHRNSIHPQDVSLSQDSSSEQQKHSAFGRKQDSSNQDSSSGEKVQRPQPNSNENSFSQELNSFETGRQTSNRQMSSQQNSISKKQHSDEQDVSSQQQSSELMSSSEQGTPNSQKNTQKKKNQRQQGSSSQQDSSSQEQNSAVKQKSKKRNTLQRQQHDVSTQQQSSEQMSSSEQGTSQHSQKDTQKKKYQRQKGSSSQQDSSSQEQNSAEKQKSSQEKSKKRREQHNASSQQQSSEQTSSSEQDVSTQQSSSFRQKNSQQKETKRQKDTSSQQDSSQQNSSEEKLKLKPWKSQRNQESSENSIDYSKEHAKKTSQRNQNRRSHHHDHNKRSRHHENYSQYEDQRQSNERNYQKSSEENTNVYEQKLNVIRKIRQGSPKSQDQSSEDQNDHIPMISKKFNMKAGKQVRLQMEEISNIKIEAYKNMPKLTEEQKDKFLNELQVAQKEAKGTKNLNATGMLMKNGYPVENHEVTTNDGYILNMVRIPAQRQNAPVVFLMHGLLGSADDWLLMGPHKSLGYMLSESGYDVWLGNARSSKYSSKHVTKQPAMSTFWEYGIDEIAQQDLPAMIDYILKKTQQQKLNYVGHSLGATVFFAMAASKPQYNEKIIKMFALSPMVYMSNVRSPVLQMIAPNKPLELLKDGEFKPSKEWIEMAGGSELKQEIGSEEVASNVYFTMTGVNMKHINVTQMPVIMAHLPAGASIRQLKQLGQAVASGKFTKFDYGSMMNEQVYGSPVPPKYRLKNVMAPVALYFSEADWLAHPMDVEKLKAELPNVTEYYKVPVTRFASTDFLFGSPARDVINGKLIASMNM